MLRFMTVILVLFTGAAPGAAPGTERIVFMGDSITDGHTYPQLVRQALADAGKPVPLCINAGLAGDTAHGMRARLKRDVLSRRPTLVTLSAGINDVLHNVKLADYEADVTAIAEALRKEKVPLFILTTSVLGPKHKTADDRLSEHNAILRRVAEKYGADVAEVNEQMQKARGDGVEVLEADAVHPNFEGQRLMARAVLDALGHRGVAVPKELRPGAMPGLVRAWQMRAIKDKEPALDEQTVAALAPDASWKKLTLPDGEKQSTWWLDHERQRGYALSLPARVGPGRSYVGVAIVEADRVKKVFFNTGAQLQTIWLNGKQIYRGAGWTGWHAGKERIAAELREGRNTVVIETAGDFFLSITADDAW